MLDAIKSLLSDLTDGNTHHSRFEDNDYRLAAAALLVHAAVIDGDISVSEQQKLRAILQTRFDLDERATEELLAQATEAEQESVDLYRFTSLLMRSLDADGRRRIVEMMWEIVYADGVSTELEDNWLWRAADLLGVSTRERVMLRQRVTESDA